jgi:hypothetical protein
MQLLLLHDPARRPASWTEIVRPGQFVVFASDEASGAPVDGEGRPLRSLRDAVCLVFDTLPEALAYGKAGVERAPELRFDVYSGPGRVEEPLETIVSPGRAARFDAGHRATRLRRWIAIVLLVGSVPLIYYDTFTQRGVLVLPTFLGASMILSALRLLFMNRVVRDSETARRRRFEQHL